MDEPIQLAAYNPRWPDVYAAEALRISSELPTTDIVIEHIGSTAVPGLMAKPIIDVMVGTKGSLATLRPALVALGYEDLGEAGVPDRIYLRRRDDQAFNVALVERDGKHWKSNLALREFLRANPEAAQKYAEIKCTAFERGNSSLQAYSDFKGAFVTNLLLEALDWLHLQ